MDYSILIPTCNRPELLERCLRVLLPQAKLGEGRFAPVWITDDGADEATRAMLAREFPEIGWTRGPRRGPAANRNHGARQVTSEWIVFLDDDCLPEPGLLKAYADKLANHPDRKVLEGRILPDRPRHHPLEECPINDKGGNLWSCNFAIRRDLFLEMEGFDERFPSAAGEDWEFRYRLQKNGILIDFVPEATVIHPWRKRSWRGHWEQHGRLLEGSLRVLRIHPELLTTWRASNVAKDVVRYYVRTFFSELRRCGYSALIYQPMFVAIQARRWWRHWSLESGWERGDDHLKSTSEGNQGAARPPR